MPSFAHPVCLWLLVLVPPLLWWWRQRGRAALRYSSTDLLRDLPRGRSVRAQRGGLWLRGCGLVFLIVALAGPRWPYAGTRLPTEGIAIAIVVDVSASMNERDFLWDNQLVSRLEAVKKVFHLFVEGGEGPGGARLAARPQDLIGLVTFATRPETACPLTLDHGVLVNILDAEEARTIATEATTNPGDALAWALNALQKAPTLRKVLIFLTDGESNVPPPALTPRQAAQLAGNLQMPIYAIGAGPEFTEAPPREKAPGKPGDEARQDPGDVAKARKTMEDVARISKGEYFLAVDGKALVEACRQIDGLERTRIKSIAYSHYHEGFKWFAVLSLLAWLALLGLESTRWQRVP